MERVTIRRTDGPEILFNHWELESPDTGVVKLAPGFADKLATLRMIFGRPMIVNSCCRSKAYNDATPGAHPRSLHVYDFPHWPTGGSCAIDIHIPDGAYAAELTRQALIHGWSVGVAKTFLHLDRRDCVGLPQVVFGYG